MTLATIKALDAIGKAVASALVVLAVVVMIRVLSGGPE